MCAALSWSPPPGPPSPPDEREARPLTEADISSVVNRLYDKDHYANRERQHREGVRHTPHLQSTPEVRPRESVLGIFSVIFIVFL